MDALIRRFDAEPDGELMVCAHRGVAYQRNMGRGRIAYDAAYFAHYRSLGGTAIERALNAGRRGLVERHVHTCARVLDVGIGSGAFVQTCAEAGFEARGFDVNPHAVAWLRETGLYAEDPGEFDAVTLWDCIEHMEDPHLFLRNVRRSTVLCAAIPVMEDLARTRESKHFKPGEHLYYWTADGFIGWMAEYGFRLLERSDHEVEAGRTSIGAFVFRRDLPDYKDYIGAYSEMHAQRHYGSSATELHLDTAASVVRAQRPKSIIDYGCGRSDLVAHFWNDGARHIARYDPAIPVFKRMPAGRFDLALVCDVMEHIPMACVDLVLEEVRAKSDTALFTISLKLARAKLPDGRNAHVTVLTRTEWVRWIRDVFGAAKELPSHSEHELVLLAGPRTATAMELAA